MPFLHLAYYANTNQRSMINVKTNKQTDTNTNNLMEWVTPAYSAELQLALNDTDAMGLVHLHPLSKSFETNNNA